MARRDGNGVRLYTHNGYDFAGRFPQIVEAVAKLKVRSCFMAARPSWSMSVASQRLTCCAPGVITMLLSFVPSISSNLMAKTCAAFLSNQRTFYRPHGQFSQSRAQLQAMSILFDPTDFSVVVKKRAPPPKPWRWRSIGLVERAR
jgi:hypothetical protein